MNETLETIASAGVVGAGGAGFPTHVKLQAEADTLIINAAECEPLLQKDKELLRRRTDGVLAGAEMARMICRSCRAALPQGMRRVPCLKGRQFAC